MNVTARQSKVRDGKILEKTGYEDQIRIGFSFFLNYDLGAAVFDTVYLMTLRDIIDRLNDMGRIDERITWVQGEAIPMEDFPLPPELGPGTHLYIHATCRIPTANVKTGV